MKSFEMGNRIKLHKRCDIRYTVFISKTKRKYMQNIKSEGGSMIRTNEGTIIRVCEQRLLSFCRIPCSVTSGVQHTLIDGIYIQDPKR